MNPERTKQAIGVMQAHLDGAKIEARETGALIWQYSPYPVWDWRRFDYRVQPEPPKPREWWLVKLHGGPFNAVLDSNTVTHLAGQSGFDIIHVREVLEEQP